MERKNSKIHFARYLRKKQTIPETRLWERIRGRKLNGFKFRRQHPIARKYIVDFYCAEKKLIIEIDGSIHSLAENKFSDKTRENFLLELGYHIIRFENKEVMNDMQSVLVKIVAKLNAL